MSRAITISRTAVYLVAGLFAVMVALFLPAGCSDDNPASPALPTASINPKVQFVDHSGCNMDFAKSETAEVKCLAYTYDGQGVLQLTDISTWFNCCVIKINGYIWFHDGEIEILETEFNKEDEVCDCYCPYDLNYEVTDLPPGNYLIRLRISPDAPYVYWVDLSLTLPARPVSDTLCGNLHLEIFPE